LHYQDSVWARKKIRSRIKNRAIVHGSVEQTAPKLFDDEEATKNCGCQQINFFEFVDGAEKFGIESKASLNKTATHSQQANAAQLKLSKNPRV
jgi:hypothetical protein